MKKYIGVSRVEGDASRQAHADLPAGTYEREISKEGFFGPATHLYHRRPPTSWDSMDGPLRPRMFNALRAPADAASPWQAPLLLSNKHTQLRFWRLVASMPALARNGDGDQLLFVHSGAGELFCDYGHLAIVTGDYIVIPRGTMWRIECVAPVELLTIEASNSSFQLPDKGLLGPHAIFDPAMLDAPRIDAEFRSQNAERPWAIDIKKRDTVSIARYGYNPLDIVGWHGDLSVVRINIRDIRPLMSHRYHVPPSAHTTFVADRFVVCSFVPRPFETDPGAIKIPFFHNNDDYDEVLFYHAGNYFGRDNAAPGTISFHPSGFTHGPHPKALANMLQQHKPATNEFAVMVDTRDPLDIGAAAASCELADYVNSWKSGQ